MSKFSERLSNLGHTAPAKMGFGRPTERDKSPVMLLIGRGSATAEHVDLIMRTDAGDKSDGDWGLEVNGSAAPDIEAATRDGCQFVLISSEDASAELLLNEELAVGMPVADGLSDSRIRAIEDGPFEFLTCSASGVAWPLSVGSVLKLQDLISSFSKHIFLEISGDTGLPGEKDLDILKNLPVSAIVIDLDRTKPDDVAALKERIGKLEPRKHAARPERSPLVPLAGRHAAEEVDAGDAGYDDDDDDWDD